MESPHRTGPVHYRTAAAGGVHLFYREAGPAARSYLDLDGLRGQYLSGVQTPRGSTRITGSSTRR
jgi:hypothetical protein